MSKNLVPEPGKIYILNFTRYITTWRLKEKSEDDAYVFFTSAGAVTKPVTLSRFQFVCRHNLIAILHQPAEIKATDKLEIQIKRTKAFKSKEYSKEELDSLIDDIDDITF